MKLSEFILLNEKEKASAVLHLGVLIGKRKRDSLIIFLFQLENYYVESFWSLQNKSPLKFTAFNNTKNLSPYLEAISLDELMQ